MADALVKTSLEDGVLVITIDHPPVNTLSASTILELSTVLDQARENPNAKVVVLTGAGNFAFIAGADVGEIARIPNAHEGRRLALEGQAVITKLERLAKPTIAAINALCLGGGNEMAMACHIRIASERARFGQPEINLGIIPGFGGTQRLPRLVGLSKAIELTLTGDVISAQEALQIGLVNKIVPPEEVLKYAKDLAKKIAGKGQVAVRLALEALQLSTTTSLPDGLAKEAELFGNICETEDMREGLTAFLQKRQPSFKDR